VQKKKLSVLVIEPNVQRRQALLQSLKDEGIRILGAGADIAEAMIYANAKNPNPEILLINIDPCWEIGVQEWVMIKAAVPGARIIAWFTTFNCSCVETALAVGVAGLFQEHDHYPGIMDLIWRVADGAEEIDEEVLERLRTSFRQSQDADVFRFRGFHMDLSTFETTLHGASLKLSPLEFKLLMYFLRNCNREVSGEELLENVWNQISPLSTLRPSNPPLNTTSSDMSTPALPKNAFRQCNKLPREINSILKVPIPAKPWPHCWPTCKTTLPGKPFSSGTPVTLTTCRNISRHWIITRFYRKYDCLI